MAGTNIVAGLIDSDILIDATHAVPDAHNLVVAQRSSGGLNISVISAMELVQGCRNSIELTQIRQFLHHAIILPVNSSASQTAYQLMDTFFLSHGLMIPDALIAATALERSLTLYTKNIRHFQMIPQLSVVRPY